MADGGAPNILPGFNVDVSHQEIDQILTELEEIYKNQPTDWLGVRDIGIMLAHMWYEDMDEFEDAIKGSFEEFVSALPHCETKTVEGRLVFRIKPDPPVSTRKQLKLTFTVKTNADLRRVLLKAPDARIEVPSIEFQIGADTKRSINSLYNHIAVAKQNLGFHAETNAACMPAEEHLAILETIEQLSKLLDVDEPFTIVVHDPSGLSELKPAEGASFEWGEAAVSHESTRPVVDPTNAEPATYADAD
jgi:C4-type Zn-finger protein